MLHDDSTRLDDSVSGLLDAHSAHDRPTLGGLGPPRGDDRAAAQDVVDLWSAPSRDLCRRPEAVSYTHLDVYKRQTLQNYFRMYSQLAGMTGTAQTEAAELNSIYKLGVVTIPTNKPMIRMDQADLVYRTEDAKFAAVVDDIADRYAVGQPVLVGTVSVEKSEHLSGLLRKRGVKHEVLNAKQHAREAAIIAEAGRKGAVTVATNMAGRGTDIMLGGNSEFRAVQELKRRGLDLSLIHI